jgi:hypothetical protein
MQFFVQTSAVRGSETGSPDSYWVCACEIPLCEFVTRFKCGRAERIVAIACKWKHCILRIRADMWLLVTIFNVLREFDWKCISLADAVEVEGSVAVACRLKAGV